jgi:hypothetical protein
MAGGEVNAAPNRVSARESRLVHLRLHSLLPRAADTLDRFTEHGDLAGVENAYAIVSLALGIAARRHRQKFTVSKKLLSWTVHVPMRGSLRSSDVSVSNALDKCVGD